MDLRHFVAASALIALLNVACAFIDDWPCRKYGDRIPLLGLNAHLPTHARVTIFPIMRVKSTGVVFAVRVVFPGDRDQPTIGSYT